MNRPIIKTMSCRMDPWTTERVPLYTMAPWPRKGAPAEYDVRRWGRGNSLQPNENRSAVLLCWKAIRLIEQLEPQLPKNRQFPHGQASLVSTEQADALGTYFTKNYLPPCDVPRPRPPFPPHPPIPPPPPLLPPPPHLPTLLLPCPRLSSFSSSSFLHNDWETHCVRFSVVFYFILLPKPSCPINASHFRCVQLHDSFQSSNDN